jgi:hypothetical protein
LRLILAVISISTGIVVLVSFFVQDRTLHLLRSVFVEWTVIVVAFAILLGVLNVLRVHARRVQEGQGTIYSLILVGAFLVVFVPGILQPDTVPAGLVPLVGPKGSVVEFAYRHVQRPLQATLFSLMGFFVAAAAWRAFRVRSAASFVMLVACVLVLLGSVRVGMSGGWTLLAEVKDWVLSVPAMAGARGILLGIVLGTVVTGVRLLIGLDRPYSD